MPVKQREHLLHLARLRQSLAIEPHRLGVGHPVPETQPEKPHEGQPVANLIFDLVIRKVVKRAQDQRLEHQNRVQRPASSAGFPRLVRLAPDPLQSRPELLPRHNGINLDQWVLLRI